MNTRTAADSGEPAVSPNGSRPAPPVYRPPDDAGLDLRLDRNEGPAPPSTLLGTLRSIDAETLRRYPDAAALEAKLAADFSVPRDRVLVASGGDDAIDRLCRAALGPSRTIVTHAPSFEMIEVSACAAGASVRAVEWTAGPFPLDELVGRIDRSTGLASIVSPNNPTGLSVGPDDVVAVARRAAEVGAAVLADLAYVEFDDQDPTPRLLREPNVVVVRTFSKALGLAGLRVGYALGPAPLIDRMRSAGGPYPVAGVALALAAARLDDRAGVRAGVEAVRRERVALSEALAAAGARVTPSRANFVFAQVDDAPAFADAMAARGIAVRTFPGRPGLERSVRITCPGEPAAFDRLLRAVRGEPGPPPARTHLGAIDARTAVVERSTNETWVRAEVSLDGPPCAKIDTRLGFLDHMLDALARHARLGLDVRCIGDLEVDDHHTVEDCALALGAAIARALGDRRGVERFGVGEAPLDEALARCVIDLSGRPYAHVALPLAGPRLGAVASENIPHFFHSLAMAMRATLHLDLIRGDNDHHKAEAAFKAFAIALRRSVARAGGDDVPSTKGTLS